MIQSTETLVCQVCGRAVPKGTDHWLDEPQKGFTGIHVVRCPQHWTDWALRNTIKGRTREMRDRMAEARAHPNSLPSYPTYLDPYV